MGMHYKKIPLACEPEDYQALAGAVARYLDDAGDKADIAVICAILGIERISDAGNTCRGGTECI